MGTLLRRRRHSLRADAAAIGDPRQARDLGRDPGPGFCSDGAEVGAADAQILNQAGADLFVILYDE